ncbi:MAG: dihydrolipoamide acetyltransferase family protein [Bdellovibrionales bacterium]|nr:dihydrolipoamide acetyltransferase family protein [Bdellovibrionales bacterium]
MKDKGGKPVSLKEIKLPDLGEGVTEGELVKIRVSPGDQVVMDQVLLEVMTDKASMEIPSFLEGTIKEIKAKEGDMVAVGQVLFLLETEGGAFDQAGEKVIRSSSEKNVGKENKGISSGKDTSIPEQPDKESKPPVKAKTEASASSPNKENIVLAVPATRRLAQELDIDLSRVSASGSEGQVTREDLVGHVKSALKSPIAATSSPPLKSQVVEAGREPLRGIKRIMFETMTYSKQTIPHFTIMERAEVSQLVKIRTELKEQGAKQGVKITYLPFIMKAALSALKKFPVINSYYDEEAKEIVYSESCHFGFAVDTEKGLVVPVIRDAQTKSLVEIAKELETLGEQARTGTIQREDLQGGTFTFTNLGSLGGIAGTPIIHPPQAAIFGIYRIYHQPARNQSTGEWEETPYMNFSLTCDHRFIDGACAARFLKACAIKIEEPGLLVMDE